MLLDMIYKKFGTFDKFQKTIEILTQDIKVGETYKVSNDAAKFVENLKTDYPSVVFNKKGTTN